LFLQVLAFPPWAVGEDVRAVKVELKAGGRSLRGGWDSEKERDSPAIIEISFNEARTEMHLDNVL
jgi:hypothetical protein